MRKVLGPALRALTVFLMIAGITTSSVAASISSAVFTGGPGTATVGGVLYAKSGGALTLTILTSSDTECVDVTGAHTGHQQSSTPKSTWTFSFTAGTGDGVRSVNITVGERFNPQNVCTTRTATSSAAYIADNTGPVVRASLSPAPNALGWNNSTVTITWSATDAGSGVPAGGGPTPATDTVTASTAGVTKTATATDRLSNSGTGSVTVRLDNDPPSITGSRSPAANANGWNNTDVTVSFACSDALSGMKSCSGPTTLSANGANQSVTGNAADNANNSAGATVSGISIDKGAPTLSGAPTTNPNAAGWYNADVTIHWSASDGVSGVDLTTLPGDTTITSEGSGLTASASVSDVAGNTATAASDAVKIDKTAPVTTATAPADWNNTDVTVALNASDGLSGVGSTFYMLDGDAQQQGTSVPISAEGTHTLEFWSTDTAGNEEAHQTVQVKIDKTPPTINHAQDPTASNNGWNNSNVTVMFTCADPGGSGIASCTGPQTVTTEGANQLVTGTAQDKSGNTATDPATVSIDKSPPTIHAVLTDTPNGEGWFNHDVSVSFTCSDGLSGVGTCPASETLDEGGNQSASGTATDAAGNTASDGVNGINVDETAPSLKGTPGDTDWVNHDVTVSWSCSDALSGIDGACPADSTITGEGENLSASATVSDKAGNPMSATVSGIKIDRSSPSTTASVPDPLGSGWYAGDVQVTLTAFDSLSGVDRTYYSIDGGPAQLNDGPFNLTLRGIHTITFWTVDRAGNVEDSAAPEHVITIKIDGVPPTITGSQAPAANGFGWNNTPVMVSFNCEDAESGIASCSGPTTLFEGPDQSANGVAEDNAGNSANTMVGGINIDLTPPELHSVLPDFTGESPGATSWYNGDVTVKWDAKDALSGIDSATQPADTVVTSEGRNLGIPAGGVSVSDEAGNATSNAALGGINIDHAGPTISRKISGPQGANGWYTGKVVVDFTCIDPQLADGSAGSGVAACPTSKELLTDGVNQGVVSDPAKDYAGNSTPGLQVGGISIDGTPPVSGVNNSCGSANNYCQSSATLVFTPTDATSGVDRVFYAVNGGASMQATAQDDSTWTAAVSLSGSGSAKITYYSVDKAGNQELPTSIELLHDSIAPSITHAVSPAPNDADWNNTKVAVGWTAKDDDSGSGVNPSTWAVAPTAIGSSSLVGDGTTFTASSSISAETPATGTRLTATVDDKAANTGTDSVSVKVDQTAPTITASVSPASPDGSNGWYVSPVKVSFTCFDALSGIPTAACPDIVALSTSGSNQSVTRSVSDAAANPSSATVSGLNIDVENPTITSVNVANGNYTVGNVPSPSCSAIDSFSGVASCTVQATQTSGTGPVGTFGYMATATDKAGNKATESGSYRVSYGFTKFSQPINDTAHTGQKMSVFKAGSTVPVKFQLKNAAGTPIQAATAPVFVNVGKVGLTTGQVNSAGTNTAGDTGAAFKWDSSGQQYIFNWKSPNEPMAVYRVGVKLDDGMTYTVDIGLK